MRTGKNVLLHKMKWTILGLAIAMLAIWLLSFVAIKEIIQRYAMENMEQTSTRIINELNDVFLQMEELSFAMSDNQRIQDFITTEDSLQFHTKAAVVEKELEAVLDRTTIADNVIIYNEQGRFYRFTGNLSNVSIQRIERLIKVSRVPSQMQITIDKNNYIGYISCIYDKDKIIGKLVMLINEEEVIRLFHRMESNEAMKFAIAADHKVVLSTEKDLVGAGSDKFLGVTPYHVRKQVGFTPFQLMISYERAGHEVNGFFIISMVIMALLYLCTIGFFARLWKKQFFEPVQIIINGVEGFDREQSEVLPMTGLTYLDGLVSGINEMVERIEQKEKELYGTALSMQQLEVKKQKALIISLKKQISAHFTINILNIIRALSANGENEKVGLLCEGLSNLIRYANEGDSFVNGMEEFFVIGQYIEMMEIRYRNKFKAELEPEDYLEEIMLPRMLLQPIIENSIVHGFVEKTADNCGLIQIYSRLEERFLCIVIEDNGCGLEADKLCRLRLDIMQTTKEDKIEVEGLTHVALINIQRRIYSYFGDGYGIEIESKRDKGTRVVLRLPILKS